MKQTSKIATLPNKNRKKRFVSRHTFGELTALCPVTRLPDFYTIRLTYEPDRRLPELKSLKLYFLSFRDVEILHEEIANRILDDLTTAIRPRWAEIVLEVNNRGGVLTRVARRWSQGKGDEQIDLRILEDKIDASRDS